MKKFLLSLTLSVALLGVSLSASAQPCTVSNLFFKTNSFTTSGSSCTLNFDIGWKESSNGGKKWSIVHLWLADQYQTFNYANNGKKPPQGSDITAAFGTIVIKDLQLQSTYPNTTSGIQTPVLNTQGATVTRTSNTDGSFTYLITGLSTTFTNCPNTLAIKGDVWASQQTDANQLHCFDRNLNFLPPTQDLNVSGSLTCGFKNGYPDNKFTVEMSSSNSSTAPVTVSYDVFVDNGDGSFNSANDLKVGYRTVSGENVFSTKSYAANLLDYTPYSKDYAYINRSLWINVAATTSLGNQFTRLYKITNTCSMPAAPTANSDYFDESTHMLNTIKANVYGGQTRWTNELGAGSDFTTSSINESPAVNGGLDVDPTDAPIGSMLFTLVPGSYLETTSCNGAGTVDFTFNSDGTFSIDRSNKICVFRVAFKYTITNTITNQVSGVATVTVDFQPQSILPVSYKSFTASRSSNSQVVLEWETAMEENNRGFHVQRNIDGNWKNIGFVFSQADGGNSSAVLKYAFKDANSHKGISQYRVLQVDMDGKGKYSEVRAVRGEEMAARLTLYPNPSTTGSFTLLFEDAASVRDVIVNDVSGRTVKQYKSVSNGSLAVDNLDAGFYTVQVLNRTNGAVATEKVIIKKR